MKKILLSLTLALTALSAAPVRAQELSNDASDYELFQRFGGQVLLGDVLLGLTRSQPQLTTRTCQQNFRGRVDSIRFQVLGAAADINSLQVQFGNGQWETINPQRRHFRPGQTSQWFNLRGNDRCVRRIIVDGDTDNEFFFTRARVRIWARM